MKLKDTFITFNSGDDHIMVASDGFTGMVRSNETASFIIESLKESVTLEDMTSKVTDRFNVSVERASEDIQRLVSQLEKIGAVDGSL